MEATYILLLQMCFNLLCKPEVQEANWPVSWEQFEKWVLRFAPAPWESWSFPKKMSHIFFPITMVLNWKYIFSPSHYIFSNILVPFMEFIAKSPSGLPSSETLGNFRDCCWGGKDSGLDCGHTPKTPTAFCTASVPVSSGKSLLTVL